jgi:hypothetical protein
MKYLGVFLLLFTTLTFGQDKSILFIGNSYTYSNNLPLMVYNLGLNNGDSITYDSSTPGGHQFNQHVTNPITLGKINSRNWDAVILQEQSQLPALPEEIAGFQYSPPHADSLNTLIKENDSCTQVVFFMTWGRKYGDASFCEEVPAVCTYLGMQQELRNTYLAMAEENAAIVAPVGIGFKNVIADDPAIELYVGDGSHPNLNGSYLSACIIYSSIYQKSPIGNAYTSGLSPEMATYLQEVAHYTVFDSLNVWRIGIENLRLDFNYTNEGLTYTFINNSENEEIVSWLIDGNSYETENPTHTFTGAGEYEVVLTVSNWCDTLKKKIVLSINADGSTGMNTIDNRVEFYPNPVNQNLYITLESFEESHIEILDFSGRIVYQANIFKTGIVDVSTLKPGPYLLRVGNNVNRFVKN